METNREHYKHTPLCDVETAYRESWCKGFNKGFFAWLDFPYYKKEFRNEHGRLLFVNGKEYKGRFYTNEEFAEYKRQGMIGPKEPICSFK